MKIETFRRRHPVQTVRAGGQLWGVIETRGKRGAPVLVMLPGTLGTAEIFWNQIVALEKRIRIVSVTYPPVGNILRLADGLAALFDKLGISKASVVGSSLGGYLGQWFAARHPKWDERPVAAIVLRPGLSATKDELKKHIAGRFAKYWDPDDYVFMEQIPRTSTGKFLKSRLRELYGDVLVKS